MTPRLYIDTKLVEGALVSLTPDQAHYLRGVLRREVGAEILVFNARDGEFAAAIAELGKKSCVAMVGAQRRAPAPEFDIQLLFAPVKRGAVETIIQKGTELGVQRFSPVMTERTNAERLRLDRLASIAIEAAEQSERLSAPMVDAPKKLAAILADWDDRRVLVFCDEAGDDSDQKWGGPDGRAPPLQQAVGDRTASSWALIIGPEGGFSPSERAQLRAAPFVLPVSLGPRILRADTAAIAALTLLQASKGDLRAD
jgi:16S rRNA (uracil1498-N3)-methyltransferase